MMNTPIESSTETLPYGALSLDATPLKGFLNNDLSMGVCDGRRSERIMIYIESQNFTSMASYIVSVIAEEAMIVNIRRRHNHARADMCIYPFPPLPPNAFQRHNIQMSNHPTWIIRVVIEVVSLHH